MIDIYKIDDVDDAMIQEFNLGKNDLLYSLILDNIKIGYGIIREDINNKLFIFISDSYQNKGYGSLLFKKLLDYTDNNIICKVPIDNIKMSKIVKKYNGIEISRDGENIIYRINKN